MEKSYKQYSEGDLSYSFFYLFHEILRQFHTIPHMFVIYIRVEHFSNFIQSLKNSHVVAPPRLLR